MKGPFRGHLPLRVVTARRSWVPAPQSTNFIGVSGGEAWHGSQWKISTYTARFPVMGPWVQVFPFNRAGVERTVSIWGYLVA